MQNQRQSNNAEILYKKRCKYIGSIAITTFSHEDRLNFVNSKMLEMKEGSKGIAVILVVTNEGIKAFNERETAVKFAHSISSTAFSTCLPNKRLFSYVARSKQSGGKSIIQAHVFRTKKSRHSHRFSSSVSNAFSIAFSHSETRQKSREQVFQSEAELQFSKSVSAKKTGGKVWAKLEIAKGHDFASHAMLARVKGSSPLTVEKNELFTKDRLIEINAQSISLSENNSVESKKFTNESNGFSNEALTPDKNQDKRKISSSFTREIVELNRQDQPFVINESKVRASTIDVVSISDRFSGNFFTDSKTTQQYENIVIPKKDYNDETVKPRSQSEALNNNYTDSCNSTGTPVDKSINGIILANCEWFQPGFSREIAEEVLEHQPVGSFIVRDSMSHLGCYVITIKVPQSIKYNGFGNFLIERVENNFYRIKGFTSTYPTLLDLITFYGSIEQDIPCRLRLANNNPLFSENNNTSLLDRLNTSDDDDDEYDDPDYEYFNTTDEIMKELQSQQ